MVCERCGKEVDDGATFCNQCGNRVDGKKACPVCGKANDKDFAYCQYCGARIDGKTVCDTCGVAHEGAFCPSCGKGKATEEVAVTATATAGVKAEKKPFELTEKHKTLLDKIGAIGLMVGVFFSLLFVFFIGVEINMASAAEEMGGATRDIFYYVFDFLKQVKTMTVGDAKVDEFLRNSATVYGVLALAVSLATLTSVITFGVRAIITYVKGLLGKTDKKADKWAILTIVSFYIGVGAFFVLNKNEMSVMGITVEMERNGATSAGMVLGALGLATYLICHWTKKWKELLQKGTLIKLGFIAGGILLLSIVCTMARNVGAYVAMTESGMTMDGAQAYLPFSIAFIQGGEIASGTVLWSKTVEMTVYSMIAQALSVMLVIASVKALFAQINNLTGEKHSFGVKETAGVAVLALALLISEILMMTALKDVYELAGAQGVMPLSVEHGHVIGLFVVSVLALALAIVTGVYYKKAKEKKQAEEAQTAQSNQVE